MSSADQSPERRTLQTMIKVCITDGLLGSPGRRREPLVATLTKAATRPQTNQISPLCWTVLAPVPRHGRVQMRSHALDREPFRARRRRHESPISTASRSFLVPVWTSGALQKWSNGDGAWTYGPGEGGGTEMMALLTYLT